MYCNHFGLTEYPFVLASNPRFLFPSKQHTRMKAYIEYAARAQESLVVCTGDIGCGKTTLINEALDRFPKLIDSAFVRLTKMSDADFLATVLHAFGASSKANAPDAHELRDQLYRLLIDRSQNGRRVILFVDEAQYVTPSILEEIRLLADLEHKRRHVLSIVLAGQPELMALIDTREMENFRQRIRLRLHLGALDKTEIKPYIDHRLKTAGASLELFSESLMPMIHQYTGGRPRLINKLCDFALTTAFIAGEKTVSEQTLATSIEELEWDRYQQPSETVDRNATARNSVAANDNTNASSSDFVDPEVEAFLGAPESSPEPALEATALIPADAAKMTVAEQPVAPAAEPVKATPVALAASEVPVDPTATIAISEISRPVEAEVIRLVATESKKESPEPTATVAPVDVATEAAPDQPKKTESEASAAPQPEPERNTDHDRSDEKPDVAMADDESGSETVFMSQLVPKIVVRRGAEPVGTFLLDKKNLHIGRMVDNDIALNDPFMSRYHAQVFTKNGVSVLRDLNSKNGIFIGQSKVALQELVNGMTFTIGDHNFTFESARLGSTDPDATQDFPAWTGGENSQGKPKDFSLLRLLQR